MPDELFAPEAVASPRYGTALELTAALLRGLVIARPLRSRADHDPLLDEWADVLDVLLAVPETQAAGR